MAITNSKTKQNKGIILPKTSKQNKQFPFIALTAYKKLIKIKRKQEITNPQNNKTKD
jgi:hypothetical protein